MGEIPGININKISTAWVCRDYPRLKDCVHYQRFKDLELPICSGEVESPHKYIPQKKIKNS